MVSFLYTIRHLRCSDQLCKEILKKIDHTIYGMNIDSVEEVLKSELKISKEEAKLFILIITVVEWIQEK